MKQEQSRQGILRELRSQQNRRAEESGPGGQRWGLNAAISYFTLLPSDHRRSRMPPIGRVPPVAKINGPVWFCLIDHEFTERPLKIIVRHSNEKSFKVGIAQVSNRSM